MANKVNASPALAAPYTVAGLQGIQSYLTNFYQALFSEMTSHALAINALIDQAAVPTAPIILPSFAKASLPSASDTPSAILSVSDDVGGYTIAFSDGTNWRRVQDRNVIS